MIYISKAKKNKKKTVKLKVGPKSVMAVTEEEFRAYQDKLLFIVHSMVSEGVLNAIAADQLIDAIILTPMAIPEDVIV